MSTKLWRQTHKEKMKGYARKHYKNHKDECRREVLSRRAQTQAYVTGKKFQLGCSRCPERHPACLDFHHVDPKQKESTIATAIKMGWAIPRLEKEMAKCIVLCANCHRKEHAGLV